MSLVRRLLIPLSSGKTAAEQYSESVLATSPLAYFRMNEKSGSVLVDSSGNGYDGTITGVTLNSLAAPKVGDTAHSYDGVNDTSNANNATYLSALDGANGCLSFYFRASAAGVWTDATNRYLAVLSADASNFMRVDKTTTDGQVRVRYAAGGTLQSVLINGLSGTDWYHLTVSWSDAVNDNELRVYLNGVQSGTTQTANGTWSGAIVLHSLGSLDGLGTGSWSGGLYGSASYTVVADASIIALGA